MAENYEDLYISLDDNKLIDKYLSLNINDAEINI